MCSIILITQFLEQTPLLVAANRDEKLDRPAAGPRLDSDCPIPRVRPVDQSQGGTWIGINAMGVFAGITNRFMAPNDPLRKSRGELPLKALEEPSARMATNRLSTINPSDYNAFHLIVADLREAWVIWSDGERLSRESLPPGIHVITESSFDAGPNLRRGYLEQRLAALTADASPSIADLQNLLGESTDDSFGGPCVHLPQLGYGTRSSSIITWAQQPSKRLFHHSKTPPDQPQWEDYTALMQTWG